jgi:uncharacterized protein (DUF488 family)
LADIRTIPRSKHNPQFEAAALQKSLREAGIEYLWMKGLGGLRKSLADSRNLGWRNTSFRGFADYMQTEDFRDALQELMGFASDKSTVLMCAEALPWRCHRSLVADALTIRRFEVLHIMGRGQPRPHSLTRFAVVSGEDILYPSDEPVRRL